MPRINIEEKFWVAVASLSAKLGDEDRAIGMAVRFFRISQDEFRSGKGMSEEDFKAAGFSEHLIPVFAERTEKGIEARGSNKLFKWLVEGDEFFKEIGKKGGLVSSMRERNAKGHFIRSDEEDVQASSKREPSVVQAAWENSSTKVQASNPSSYSYSYSSKEKKNNKRKEAPKGAIPEFSLHPLVAERLSSVTHEAQKTWIEVYENDLEWLRLCMLDCVLHFQAKNEEKKNWGSTFLNWFKSGYNKRKRTVSPSVSPGTSDLGKPGWLE